MSKFAEVSKISFFPCLVWSRLSLCANFFLCVFDTTKSPQPLVPFLILRYLHFLHYFLFWKLHKFEIHFILSPADFFVSEISALGFCDGFLQFHCWMPVRSLDHRWAGAYILHHVCLFQETTMNVFKFSSFFFWGFFSIQDGNCRKGQSDWGDESLPWIEINFHSFEEIRGSPRQHKSQKLFVERFFGWWRHKEVCIKPSYLNDRRRKRIEDKSSQRPRPNQKVASNLSSSP